ncbi:flavodoxin [Dactylosporangium fulvum]|uniref:Flavodoxin domain-containing protein n=1 Tax=Dactylosporangium fulvum TaxID=53359 RepID=A0ABY5W9R1_9ACTN|nr:flavodoxin domain-containing protein [Dactylosporangium fulvum]UWP86812.1 flavodoxin domain-containing protein [Dactylosporangium fulvum]
MRVVILFGTESGTAEFVANDLSDAIAGFDDTIEVDVVDMTDQPVDTIDVAALHLVVCSTYGDGELPASARPFHAGLERERPNLTGLRYAMFGMGDSSYIDTYSHGSEIIDATLTGLGATRVGEYGRHDASGRDAASDVALTWLEGLRANVLLTASER